MATYQYRSGGYNGGELVARSMAFGTQTLALGQWATDVVQRMARPDTPLAVSAACIYGGAAGGAGSVAITLDDRDGNGTVSVGDIVSVVMDNCFAPVLMRPASGSLRIDVAAGTGAGLDTAVVLRVTPQTDFRLLSAHVDLVGASAMTGAFNVRWEEGPTTQQLRVSTVGDEELGFTPVASQNTRPDRFRGMDLRRVANFAGATVETSLSFVQDVNDGLGRVAVTTPQPLRATLRQQTSSGEVRIAVAEGYYRINVADSAVVGGYSFQPFNPQGEALRPASSGVWDGFHRAMHWDGHSQLYEGQAMPGQLPAWLETDSRAFSCVQGEMRDLCYGVTPPDFVFIHPVLARPAIASALAEFRWQMALPLADVQPALQFRLFDCDASTGTPQAGWDVPATFERRGALFIVRPQERLRQGRRYALGVSEAGMDWNSSVTLRLADGTTRWMRGSGICFSTPRDLLVDIQGATTVPAFGLPTTLTARVTAAQGQAIASYRWQQLSGAPVRLGSPSAAVTTVGYDSDASRVLDDVVLQVTVTDAVGNVQTSRVQLNVGDRVDSGDVAYLAKDVAGLPRQYGLLRGPRPDPYSWRPGSASAYLLFPQIGSVIFATGDGEPLTARRYEGVLSLQTPGAHPGIDGGIYPGDCLGTLSGWFEILEIERDLDGVPTRLSLDFVLTCSEPRLPTQPDRLAGSYRFNSSLPFLR